MFRFIPLLILFSIRLHADERVEFVPTKEASQESQRIVFLDFAKEQDGRLMQMNQESAAQYCASQGARLPSARELAQLAMDFGSKGIVSPENCSFVRSACSRISPVRNSDGSQDRFIYDREGYQRSATLPRRGIIWSSSVDSNWPRFAFALDLNYGEIDAGGKDYNFGLVRCVLDR